MNNGVNLLANGFDIIQKSRDTLNNILIHYKSCLLNHLKIIWLSMKMTIKIMSVYLDPVCFRFLQTSQREKPEAEINCECLMQLCKAGSQEKLNLYGKLESSILQIFELGKQNTSFKSQQQIFITKRQQQQLVRKGTYLVETATFVKTRANHGKKVI